MNQLQRIDLISKIGRELQARMTYGDINVYLAGFGVTIPQDQGSINSKWVYVKNILSHSNIETIIKIANELEINHPFISQTADCKNWKVNHFRLFLSHLSKYKKIASYLQKSLFEYGISSFVAHEDITPTKEWQIEIESSLLTMDALVAILTPEFKESPWTDHEVGAAIGRNLYIIPLDKGLKPYGFIAKYQAMPTIGKTVNQVAEEIFSLLITQQKTKYRMTESVIELVISSFEINTFAKYFKLLTQIDSPAIELLVKLKNNIINKDFLFKDETTFEKVNHYLSLFGIPLIDKESQSVINTDDIPF